MSRPTDKPGDISIAIENRKIYMWGMCSRSILERTGKIRPQHIVLAHRGMFGGMAQMEMDEHQVEFGLDWNPHSARIKK